MKRQHKVNFGWQRPAEPISDSYQRELDRTADKAEIRWRRAQRALERAEKAKEQAEARARQEPTPQTLADRDEARMAVLARLAELREIEALMRPGNRTAQFRDDLAVLMANGARASDVIRAAVHDRAEAYRRAHDYGDVPDGTDPVIRGCTYSGELRPVQAGPMGGSTA
jgi:hypothetical protein